jgi:hypothetical protein
MSAPSKPKTWRQLLTHPYKIEFIEGSKEVYKRCRTTDIFEPVDESEAT